MDFEQVFYINTLLDILNVALISQSLTTSQLDARQLSPNCPPRCQNRPLGGTWRALVAKRDLMNVKAVAAAKPRPSRSGEYMLADGDGLYLRVRNDGGKTWVFIYTHGGKRKKLTIGDASSLGLAEARAEADLARASLAEGVDPVERRDAAKVVADTAVREVLETEEKRLALDLTFGEMLRAWLADGVKRKDGNKELQRAFNKDVLPALGERPVRLVTEHDLRKVLRGIVARGANRQSVVMASDVGQLFSWAEKRQPWRRLLAEGNPAALVEVDKIVDPGYDMDNERSRTLSAHEIRELRNIFARMEAAYEAASNKRSAQRPVMKETQHALWVSLSTACRIGELLMARWEHVDLEAKTWFIPRSNVKKTRGKSQDHMVYLSAFAAKQFEGLRAITGDTSWCFPARNRPGHVNVKSVAKQVGDRQHQFKARKALKNRRNDNSLVLARGANGDWTPHDMRRTAATMMQALKVPLDTIDRCQNHLLPGSKVRRHYFIHEYAEEKREAWRMLGERLEAILAAPPEPSRPKARPTTSRSTAGARATRKPKRVDIQQTA
jgi:integrase